MAIRIVVDPAGYEDWQAVLALLRQSFDYMKGRINPPSSLDGMDASSLKRKSESETMILAFDDGALVGCAFGAPRAHALYVGKVAVATGMRGRGIARAMIGQASEVARRLGLPALELQARIELTDNHETFARLGFVRTGETAHEGYRQPTSVTMRRPVPLPETTDPSGRGG